MNSAGEIVKQMHECRAECNPRSIDELWTAPHFQEVSMLPREWTRYTLFLTMSRTRTAFAVAYRTGCYRMGESAGTPTFDLEQIDRRFGLLFAIGWSVGLTNHLTTSFRGKEPRF